MKPEFFLVFALLSGACLCSCGSESEVCSIDCENTSVPDSRQILRNEADCEDCRARYRDLKVHLCGPARNPDCVCQYACERTYEFP